MSASLVGSEMCIRDRGIGAEPAASPAAAVAEPVPLLGDDDGPPGTPVSYTHLTLPTICSV
eukprot:5543204-Alexandrium_andersonii.AAC.1